MTELNPAHRAFLEGPPSREPRYPRHTITIHTGDPEDLLAAFNEGFEEAIRQRAAADAGESDGVISGHAEPSVVTASDASLHRQYAQGAASTSALYQVDTNGLRAIHAAARVNALAEYFSSRSSVNRLLSCGEGE
ncbi:hypothetical protein [Glaciihabitans sp. dw_435]|uniref:hypothetical protein n=1 Tax=Glaciihabitans sp. dw_435 TaxID=2720081 RepID=UPI001BD389D4|nr:hypothetical protein [Glaciihabitans sp. dw_435]